MYINCTKLVCFFFIGNTEHEVDPKPQEEETTKRNSKRSWVWAHFTLDETTKKAKCNHCRSLIKCNKGSTSGMANHVKTKHKLSNDNEKRQLTIRESINNSEEIVSII